MLKSIKRFWNFISYLGISKTTDYHHDVEKRRVFFNQSLVFGFIALIGTVGSSVSFIGNYAYLNLIGALGVLIGLFIHSKGNYALAKRVAIYPIFITGIILTALSGGDFLYHTGVITVLAFAWIIFDPKKELPELLIFIAVTFYAYIVGELNLFNAPDFSNHPDTQTARLVNLFMYTGLTIIFLNFVRNINNAYEKSLGEALKDKEVLLEEVLSKSRQLEYERSALEGIISERTAELIEQKEFLEEKNAEKEVLLKEIHHRVKNNLQIIVSLLNLQASKFENKAVLKAIDETQNRIITMSLVHQRMYQTSNFVAIEMMDYIDQLLQNNLELFAPQKTKFTHLNRTLPELKIEIDTAIPLGLIINEMISNSFKHAFNDTIDSYKIEIDLQENSDHSFILKYKDNGAGFPENLNMETSTSLGLQLIVSLVEQINGEIKHYNDEGAVFEVTFSTISNS